MLHTGVVGKTFVRSALIKLSSSLFPPPSHQRITQASREAAGMELSVPDLTLILTLRSGCMSPDPKENCKRRTQFSKCTCLFGKEDISTEPHYCQGFGGRGQRKKCRMETL